MIPYAPHPILFSVGPVAIRYYSLAYLIGFALVYWRLRRSALREHADDLTLWVMLGVIIGGRVGEFIFYTPSLFWTDPLELFKIWHGGMSFHGGLIGCVLAVGLYVRSRKLTFWPLADLLVLPGAAAIVLGRVANFLNGELVGTVTSVPWCMTFPGYAGCRHPSQLYEAFYTIIIVGVLLLMLWRHRKHPLPAGAQFGVFLVLYGVFRFIVNFWRDDARWLGISTGQYLSVLTLAFGVWVLYTSYKSRSPRRKR